MDTQTAKVLVEAVTRLLTAAENIVEHLGSLSQTNERALAVQMSNVQQIDFESLPDDLKTKLYQQAGLVQPGSSEVPQSGTDSDSVGGSVGPDVVGPDSGAPVGGDTAEPAPEGPAPELDAPETPGPKTDLELAEEQQSGLEASPGEGATGN